MPEQPVASTDDSNRLISDPPMTIVLVAVVIPALICLINLGILKSGVLGLLDNQLNYFRVRFDGYRDLLICYAIFVTQVGIVSWYVGRHLNNNVLRLIVFVWCMVFIDLMFVIFHYATSARLSVAYAFASAQLGLLVVWSLLGRAGVGIRLFVVLLGISAVMAYAGALSIADFGRSRWAYVLICQGIATLVLCIALRIGGFRIAATDQPQGKSSDGSGDRVQFTILNLLMWTAGLAPVFALARIVDWTNIDLLAGLSQYAIYGVMFSLISLVAIWSSLGDDRQLSGKHVLIDFLFRLLVTLGFTVTVGWILGLATQLDWLEPYLLRLYLRSGEGYVFWIPWAVLAGFFYTAILLVLRARGQRLMRRRGSLP